MGQPKSGSSTVSPSSSGVAALNQVLPQVQQYLSPTTNPYTPVMLQTAEQNPMQAAAAGQYSNAYGAANTGLQTYGQASDLIQGAAQPLTQAEINQYFNPYVNQVVGATEQQFNLQNAQQQNQVVGNEAAQGALGGNRTAVAGALTAGQQAAAENPIIAGMLQAGYTQQEAMAAQQYQQVPLAAASALQGIGAGQEAAAGNLGNLALGQYGLGTQQQQYNTGAPAGTLGASTAQDIALYQEQLARYGYPIQLTNMAAGDVSGISGAYGSTTTTTPPPPSLVSGIAGLGVFGLGAGSLYNAYQASDRRLKEDIRVIGKTKDGQTIYRFRFKGHPQWHIGLMAQDVEKKHPEAVGRIGGYKAIDVKKATDAAARFAGGRVQGLQTGGVPAMPYGASPVSGLGPVPYVGGGSYIPQVGATNIARLQAAAPMAQPQDDSSNMFMNALKLSNLGSKGGLGDTVQDTVQDLTAGDDAFPAGTPGAAGGRVPRAYGGLALPSSNRINVPTRGGLGMPSSMVMRRDAGGSADMSDTSTSAGTDVPPLNPMMANITYGLYGEAAPYGAQGMAEGGTPKDDIAPDDTVLVPDETPPPEAPVQVAQGPAPAGMASDAPEIVSTGVSRRAPEDPRGMVPYIRETAKRYGIDPNVAVNVARSEGLGTFTSGIPGEKSFGAFQLNTQGGMGNEFYRDTGLDPSDPRNEKATIDYALSKAATGGWGPFHGAKNRYGYDNFAGINGNDGTQALALTEDTSGRGLSTTSPNAGGIPGVTPIKAPDISGKTKPDKTDIALSIMAAGLGMMGSRSPYAGVGIGQGGLQGIQTYEALHKQRVGEAEHQAGLEQQAAIANQHPQIQERLFAQQKAQQERLFTQQQQMEAKKAEDTRALEAMKESKQPRTIVDSQTGMVRNVVPRGDGTFEDIMTHDVIGTPRGQTPVPTQTPQNPTQPMPSNPRNASVTAPTQLVSADPGFRVRNTQFVESGQSFNYASGDTPHIEKGMVVPEPQAIGGNSVDSLKTDAKTYLQTGKLPQVSRGASPVAVSQQAYQRAVKNYANAVASSLGMTHDQVAETMRQGGMMPRFILGPAGQATVSLGTAVRHLDTLREFAKAWDANDVQTVNRLRTVISREFGDDAATNLDTVGKIVGPEIIKAIGVAGAGTADERAGAAAQFSTIASGKQMLGAIDVTQKLLGGQLEGKKRQAAASGVSEETFKNLIGDRPYEILTGIDKGATKETDAGTAKNKPQTVTQNGHTYTLQPDGSYK